MKANTMNPDKTASGYILFAIKATKVNKQTTIVVDGRKGVYMIPVNVKIKLTIIIPTPPNRAASIGVITEL